jgi:hypothetical protein
MSRKFKGIGLAFVNQQCCVPVAGKLPRARVSLLIQQQRKKHSWVVYH